MGRKEIYAALEIADHEVRLVIGELFEARLNILRVERVAMSGVTNKEITDEKAVVSAIRKAVANATIALGYRIERVLLAIPSLEVTRCNQKINVSIEDGTRTIRLFHIQSGFNKAISYRAGSHLELVNVGCIKYKVNGITSRKLPLGETCDSFVMDMDLLFAQKKAVYAYARCVEQANLEILDICLDAYAMAQEAAVFEQAIDRYVVQVDLCRYNTCLSLFAHGKLMKCILLKDGYSAWYAELKERYGLSDGVCYRLLQNIFSKDPQENDARIIFLDSVDDQQIQLSAQEVYVQCFDHIQDWIASINETCRPITQGGNTRYVISGEGMNIQVLEQLMDLFSAPAAGYVPQTIGARDGAYTTAIGMIYNWKEILEIRKDERISVNRNEMEESVEAIRKIAREGEGSFTRKLKNMLLSDK